MTAPTPYVLLPGTAREALAHYQAVFGGDLTVAEYGEMGRTDGPSDAVGHGMLSGDVTLFVADAGPDESPLRVDGLMLAVFQAADPHTMRGWFDALAEGGQVVDALADRPWGAVDGQVRDRFGVHWLFGWPRDPAG